MDLVEGGGGGASSLWHNYLKIGIKFFFLSSRDKFGVDRLKKNNTSDNLPTLC